ncbi:25407_t:CDS:2, partial [Dentiscutata erythropus]
NTNSRASTSKSVSHLSTLLAISSQLDDPDIVAKNAIGQNDAIAKIKKANHEKRLGKLKRYTKAQAKLRAKKQKQLKDNGIVEQYNKPGQPSTAMLYPELWNNIHDC